MTRRVGVKMTGRLAVYMEPKLSTLHDWATHAFVLCVDDPRVCFVRGRLSSTAPEQERSSPEYGRRTRRWLQLMELRPSWVPGAVILRRVPEVSYAGGAE